MRRSGSGIRKLYFDAVNSQGRNWIGYRLDWDALGIQWTYRELSGSGIRRGWRLSLSKASGPTETLETEFSFMAGANGASWSSRATWPHRYENEVLRWELTGIGGDFETRPDDGTGYSTYSECVTLKGKPWALGIERLRWGRVIEEGVFVTWILASGTRPISYCAVNGEAYTTGVKWVDNTLVTPVGELTLGSRLATIADGDVSEARRGLTALLARLMFGGGAIRQEKGAFDCRIRLADGTTRRAVAIAEDVRFGGGR